MLCMYFFLCTGLNALADYPRHGKHISQGKRTDRSLTHSAGVHLHSSAINV